ncbi:MAG: TRAM domain-containing protein [Syntrophomonas sp.]|nr:TRAM domain-containing protein [Syntrophomonas sp.]
MFSNLIFKPILYLALLFGLLAVAAVRYYLDVNDGWLIAIGVSVGLLFYAASYYMKRVLLRMIQAFNLWLDNLDIQKLLGGTIGLLFGVMVGYLSSYRMSMVSGVGAYFVILSFILCGCLGLIIGSRKASDVWRLFHSEANENAVSETNLANSYKVLDTSAIIDGRIYDVCQSNFLEGILMVPVFVIEELQHIADSSDNLRRNKGRRGLELLSKMQKNLDIKIDIIEVNIPEEKEVDLKLIRLCKQIGASIITNDYNLNKVAELQGIKVLNINELTNAVKVVVYPGETMYISILKEGKEPGQGVGYLEDGTMVVVEDAHDELGNSLEVLVTSVFQTAAGRMIFSRKLKEESNLSLEKANLKGLPIQEVNMYG